MSEPSFTVTFLVDQTPQQAFDAITNPRGWWSEEIVGSTDKAGEEFLYHFEDRHRCRIRVTELVPGQKVSWFVVDNYFSFIEDKTEWNGTTISFDISEQDGKTQVRFTHVGLTPEYECYDACSYAWGNYVTGSLRSLIATGEGQPNRKAASAEEALASGRT